MEEQNGFHAWLSQYVKPLNRNRRKEIIDEIRVAASPGFDYFFMVVLSAAIATLGLINDSPAVIIGAMVVAPLMSPILGVGLGSITADGKLTSNSISALIRGAIIAILLSALLTLVNIYLPFVPSLLDIPHEILSRTQPTANDLIIALAGGLAAAYALSQPNLSAALPGVAIATALMPPLCTIGVGLALGRWDIAGGASLLFLTNAVTIAFASSLVFFLEGFSPRKERESGKLPKSLLAAAVLTAILLIPLIIVGARLVSQAQENRLITTVLDTELATYPDTELAEVIINRVDDELHLEITLRSSSSLNYNQVISLQEALVARLDKTVSLVVDQIRSERVDPLIPPTPTPTATETSTPTLGPSPTSTEAPTLTVTPYPTVTFTGTVAPASHGFLVINAALPEDIQLLDEPGGDIVAEVPVGSILMDLGETVTFEGLVWVKVENELQQIGWLPEIYLEEFTITPTITMTPSN
ncbi:MAG: DUF389 domain-containing protein [Anaerolineaceae bacterium]|nr:DUF389 domain-containing protein [Anaerolineaceae bacterium]